MNPFPFDTLNHRGHFRIEFVWLKKINFYPSLSELAGLLSRQDASICLGTKSRNLGDALVLTTLPRKLKLLYPRLRIFTYPRGFNPIVFLHNPFVSGLQYLPDQIHGDDLNAGKGHLINLKEQALGVPTDLSHPRPEIHLSKREINWAARWSESPGQENAHEPRHPGPGQEPRRLCIVHPFGVTVRKILDLEFWNRVVRNWNRRITFWQVGVRGDQKISGCERHFLFSKNPYHARKLFALIAQAELFVGVDSGPMHIAAAFQKPSLILTHANPAHVFESRERWPYYLHGNWKYTFLYPQNEHLSCQGKTHAEVFAELEQFFQKPLARGNL